MKGLKMEILVYTAIAFFVGGFFANRNSNKTKEAEIEELKKKSEKELQDKDKLLKELKSWKQDREHKEGKNTELTSQIQRKEKELSENITKNNNAINALKNNSSHSKAIEEVEKLSDRLRKSIIQVEKDFATKINSLADSGNKPKGLEVIQKQKQELAGKKILPNPYMTNPYKEDNEE